ncbi:methyltransferase [Bacillus paranthracis]|nr:MULTISPECIES: methyltransferase [Bacillus cereus group]MDX6046494.1 methyltransferase [Bacillus paranthracis]
MSLKAFYNEVVATHLYLESVLMPIGDGMTVSKVKQ